jgi:hypothetical protein
MDFVGRPVLIRDGTGCGHLRKAVVLNDVVNSRNLMIGLSPSNPCSLSDRGVVCTRHQL